MEAATDDDDRSRSVPKSWPVQMIRALIPFFFIVDEY